MGRWEGKQKIKKSVEEHVWDRAGRREEGWLTDEILFEGDLK